MFRNHISWLTGTMLVGLALPAFAGTTGSDTAATGAESNAVEAQAVANEALAHKMMGHIALAQMALNLDLATEADNQIDRARDVEETLASQLPGLKLDSSFEYGKVTYSGKTMLQDHYVPVVDDVFLVSDFSTILKNKKAIDVDELSAGVLHLGISVDLRDVRAALDTAQEQIAESDFTGARLSLSDFFDNAIVYEEEIDDPELLITENLSLARAFVDNQQYDSARLTLEHVQERLDHAGKDKASGLDEDEVAEFSAALDRLRADLRKEDPTLTQRVANDLSSWRKKISGWFS